MHSKVNMPKAVISCDVTVTMLPNIYPAKSPDVYPGVRLINRAPIAIPIDQIMPMAESTRILPLSLAHSIPIAESVAKINAPPIGFTPA